MSSVTEGDGSVANVTTAEGATAAETSPDRDGAEAAIRRLAPEDDGKLPIKMLNDRILVSIETQDGERTSSGGILIPATAQMSKRLTWAEVVAVGPNVRNMEVGDRVLFNPEDRYEVEVRGSDYIILRERDIHAVASKRLDESSTGLYL
jgi:chaperonin GroES